VPSERFSPGKPLPVVIGVIAIAGVAWGLYAWKSSRTPDDSPAPSTSPANLAGTSQPTSPDDTLAIGDTDDVLPTTEPLVSSEPGRPSITANAAPSGDAAIEIKLGQVRPDQATSASQHLAEAREAMKQGDLVAARVSFTAALDRGLLAADERSVREELTRINDALLFTRTVKSGDPLVSQHVVVANENLNSIARRCKVSEDLLVNINQLKDRNTIYAGARLKLIQGPFHAVIDKSDHRMDVYVGDLFVRSFRVGLGAHDGTPEGVWRVRDKLRNPEWNDPATGKHYLADDPANPIGEHWIGLDAVSGEAVGRTGFGIHGTNDPRSIGQDLSQGCVRLLTDDIELLFQMLIERHSTIVIRQ